MVRASTRAVLLDDGVPAAMAPGSIHVNMATVSVAFARELAALHVEGSVGYVAAGRDERIAAAWRSILHRLWRRIDKKYKNDNYISIM